MKMATVKHTKIYKLYIIVSYYFMLFPEKKQLKGPFALLGKRWYCLKRKISKQRS